MFICGKCGNSSKAGESPVMQTVETRRKEYPERWARVSGERRIVDSGGFGHEIAKEIKVASCCYETKEQEATNSEPPEPEVEMMTEAVTA